MRRVHVMALAALAASGWSGRAAAQSVAPLVIHRAEIQAAGWGRVSALVQGATGWQSSDVEGFDATASPDGLPPAGESAVGAPEWLVVVDGQPVPTNLFGVHQLDLLPISIAQIDSVVVVSGPVVLGGSSSPRGAIEIFSRRAGHGFSGEFTYEHGDETGDPGPFRYTPRTSVNVEKIGPFGHADVGYAAQRWDFTLGLHGSSLNTTDSIIGSRLRGAGPVDIDALTPTLRLRVRALGGEHELLASRGEERGDLFVSNYALEQSLRSTDTYVGANGSVGLDSLTSGNYALSASTQNVAQLPSGLPFTVGHQRRLIRGEASITRQTGEMWNLTGGIAAQQWRLDRGDTNTSAITERVYVRAATSTSSSRSVSFTAAAVHAPTLVSPRVGSNAFHTSLDAQFSLRQAIGDNRALRLDASRVNAAEGASDAWIDRAVAGIPDEPIAPVVTRAALGIEQTLRSVVLTAAANVSRAQSWALQDASPSFPAAVDSLVARGNPFSSTHAVALAGFGVRLETADSARVHAYLEYDRESPISGDEAIRRAEQASLRDQLRGQLAWVPFRDLQLGAGVDLASGTAWWRFPDTSGTPGIVPPLRRVNASVEKWFWKRRLRAQYVLENILNQSDRDHPFGAQWNLRFHASVGAQFGVPDHLL